VSSTVNTTATATSSSATLTVNSATPAPVIYSFYSGPSVVCQFEDSELYASFDGAATGTITGIGSLSSATISSGGSVTRYGQFATNTRTYTLTVTNVSGTATATTTVQTIIC
jgi:hypothetical protein